MKVLFIDTVHPVLKEELEKSGHQCIDGTSKQRDELKKEISDVDGVVIRSRIKMDKDFLSNATSLKFIARSGAGMENIDVSYCGSRGISLFNAPEGNRDAVGEHLTGMMLMLFNRLNIIQDEIRENKWLREPNRGVELMGKTIGIIGYGNNGSSFAKKLSGFGCRILAYDKHKKDFTNSYVRESKLKYIQERADIVSFHVPLTEETHYYFNSDFMAKMSKPFYLLNACRGQVVETSVLVEGLKKGKILGACLDVLEYEKFSFEDFMALPPPEEFKYLVNSEKVILSPHIAGWTHASYYKLSEVLLRKIMKWLPSQNY
ncbi:MAG: hypothetical protein HKN39_01650 [Flavobacteriales bacterium]|nr:hypothetical protein [Flavobacteriales bacterium]